MTGCGKPAPVSTRQHAKDSPPTAGVTELTFTYGSEKEDWIKETTAVFNGENHRLANGRSIRVNALAMGSGDCLDEIIADARHTDLTSPASSAYVDLGTAG